MEEKNYRKRPDRQADVFWNPYGIGFSTGNWIYVEKNEIKHYIQVSETDQRTSWEHRYLNVYKRSKPSDMKWLARELPDWVTDRLMEKYPDLEFPEPEEVE